MTYIALIIIIATFFPMPKPAQAAALSRPPNNLGLVGYWGFDEGKGTKAGDRSGKGHTAGINGSTWTDGKFGKGLSFNGSSNYAAASTTPSLDMISTDITASAWIYIAGGAGTYRIIVSKNDGLNTPTYEFGLSNANKLLWYQEYGGSAYKESNTTPSLNEWHHVAFVFNNSAKTGTFYLNGVADGNVTGLLNTQTTTAPLYIGVDGPTGGGETSFFNGKIDDLRLYSRALGAGEIAALYRAGGITGKQSSKQGLVGYWPLNEGRGSKAGDFSGSGNTGTITAATWTDGRRGKGLNFVGSGYKVQTSSVNNIPSGGSARSICSWIKPQNTGGVILSVNTASGQKYVLETVKVSSTWYIFTDGVNGANNITVSGSELAPLDQWSHICFLLNGSDGWSYYLNGQYVKGGTFSVPINTAAPTSVTIGDRLDVGGYNFNGILDDVRIYNRALTAAEVRTLYSEGETQINSSQNKLNGTLDTGLVGLWSFNGQDYNSASTTAEVLDRSGNNNHGDNIGATRAIGKVGQALKFDGVDDYVSVPDSPSLDVNSITVSAWVKGTIGSGLRVIALRYIPTICWDLTASNGALVWYVGTGSGSWDLVSALGTKYINDNKWHHVVGVYNGTVGSVYVDGNFDVSGGSAGSMCTGTSPITIGAYSGSQQNLNGSIDEVRIYNRALSADEIKQLYNLGK